MRPVHVALSVSLNEEDVRAIATEVGWTSARRNNGPFDVIAVWVENRLVSGSADL